MSNIIKGKTKMAAGVAATINRLETSRAVQNTLTNVDTVPNLASLKSAADTALAILQLIQGIQDGDINAQLVDLALDSCGLVYIVVSKCESLNPLPDRTKNDVGELTGDLDAMRIFVLKKINGSLYRRFKKHGQDEQKLLEYRNKLHQWMVTFGGNTKQSVHDYLEEVIDARMRRHERAEKSAHDANDIPRIQALAQTRPDVGTTAGPVPPSSSPQPFSSASLPHVQTGHVTQTATPKPSNSDLKANSTAAQKKQQIDERLEAKRAELQTVMAEKPSTPPAASGTNIGKAATKPKPPSPEELAAARAQQEAKDARMAMILAARMEREMEEEEMAAKAKRHFKPQPKSLGSTSKPTPARAKHPSIHSEDEDEEESCDSEDCASAHVQHQAPRIEVHDQHNHAGPLFRGRQSPPSAPNPNRSNSPFAESPSPPSSYFPTGDYTSDPNLNARRSPSPHAQLNPPAPSFPSHYQQPMHFTNSSPPEQPSYGRMHISDITNSGISLGSGAVTVHNNFPPGYGNTTSINIKDSMNNRSSRRHLPDSDSDNDSD